MENIARGLADQSVFVVCTSHTEIVHGTVHNGSGITCTVDFRYLDFDYLG